IAGRDNEVSGAVSGSDTGHFLGVAPDARVVSLKVADAHGQTDVSQMLAAIDWVVQHKTDNGLNIRVLNLSFGTDSGQSYQLDPQYGGGATVGTRFFRGSGTSQAAAVMSGAAALVISQRPGITPDQLKALLVRNSKTMKGNTSLKGSGELSLASVLNTSTPSS